MFSLENICDALATCHAGTAIGTPTSATAMRATYGQMPNNVPMTPCVVIMPKTGEAIFGSGTWDTTHQIDALFYHSKRQGDIPRSETERQRWLPLLLSATKSQVALGLSTAGVKSALPTGYEFVTLTYGGDEYDGIVVHYEVIVREPITLTP
jgi:hypothetical protein